MNAIKFWTVFTIGVAAGAAVSLIYAPQTGEATRKQLKRKLDDAGDYLKDASETWSDHADKVVKRGKESWDDVSEVAGKAANKAAKAVSDLV